MDLDLLVGGLTAGSLYALVAMGFNILYRPTNVFNFAQGDLVMLGAMFGATFITLLGLPWFVGAALAMLAVAALALVEEKIAVAPVLNRSATGHGWVITTLAVSMIFANLVGLGWGPDPIAVKPPRRSARRPSSILGANISSYQIAVMVITVVLVLGVERFTARAPARRCWRWPRIATRPCCAASIPTGCRAGRSSSAVASRP